MKKVLMMAVASAGLLMASDKAAVAKARALADASMRVRDVFPKEQRAKDQKELEEILSKLADRERALILIDVEAMLRKKIEELAVFQVIKTVNFLKEINEAERKLLITQTHKLMEVSENLKGNFSDSTYSILDYARILDKVPVSEREGFIGYVQSYSGERRHVFLGEKIVNVLVQIPLHERQSFKDVYKLLTKNHSMLSSKIEIINAVARIPEDERDFYLVYAYMNEQHLEKNKTRMLNALSMPLSESQMKSILSYFKNEKRIDKDMEEYILRRQIEKNKQ